MEIEQVENLIEQIRLIMPSAGTWPFTVVRFNRDELRGLTFEKSLNARHQLLFLLRTDFDRADLNDYISNSKEFYALSEYEKVIFLNTYLEKLQGEVEFSIWREMITVIGIGLAIAISKRFDLRIEYIDADLTELDKRFNFSQKNLKAFQLYDISPCSY